MPAILAILAAVGHRPETVYQAFITQFTVHLGATPLYLTLVASAGFFVYARCRRVPMATAGLTAILLCLAFVEPVTIDLDGLVSPRPCHFWPWRSCSWRWLHQKGREMLAFGGLPDRRSHGWTSNRWPMPYRLPIGFHMTLLTFLALGTVSDDVLGRWLRNVGVALAALGCLFVMSGLKVQAGDSLPIWLPWIYPPAVCLVLATYGQLLGHRQALSAAGLILASWLVWFGWRGYCSARQLVLGLDYIALGMLSFFALAWLTSLVKGGKLSLNPAPDKGKLVTLSD